MSTATKSVVRGNTVRFDANFFSYGRVPVSPPTAQVKLTYTVNKVATTNTLAMVYVSNNAAYSVQWDTTGVDPGTVYWHVSTTSAGNISEDGQLVITANPANS